MPTKYTAEELRDASNKVMRSLNWINSKSSRTLSKDAIRNSTAGLSQGKISKSSRKRHNRKVKASLAGKSMENLIDAMEAPDPASIPASAVEFEEQRVSQVNKKAHHSRRAEKKLEQQEIQTYKPRSLDEIKAKIMKMTTPKEEKMSE